MAKPGRPDKMAVCVGTVTDDMRIFKVPKLKVNSCISKGKPLKSHAYKHGKSVDFTIFLSFILICW